MNMSATLESYVSRPVSVITSDGRNFVGTLKGFDQTINLILDETHERVYSGAQGVEQVRQWFRDCQVLITSSAFQVVLGLHIVRGDNICVIGEIDEVSKYKRVNSNKHDMIFYRRLTAGWIFTT